MWNVVLKLNGFCEKKWETNVTILYEVVANVALQQLGKK